QGPGPSSQGSAALTHGKLVAGAGGTYLPVPPTDIVPTGRDPRNPLQIPPQGTNPQGLSCPTTSLFHVGPGSPAPGGGVVAVISIHPSFARNATGGYDGYDQRFGYAVKGAIAPGGDPAAVAPGSIATAANVAGHVVAVTAFLRTRGTWVDAQSVAPYGGSCSGATFSFSPPYLAGNAPPPVPPGSVLQTPPFPIGPTLVAALTGSWRIGGVDTLPGPAPTARTFVHIPTCAWTDSDVPAQAAPLHALTATVVDGYTLFLLYEVTITPGAVTWSWGDGTSTTEAGPVEHGPTDLPHYDPTTQTWTEPCEVSHAYTTVSAGRTVTASETFSIAITVSWSDGVAVHTQPVPCDAGTGGDCMLPIAAGDGWTSGPHPVDQIEPVPFAPPSSAP
ncbi:MAG: hypothetical protein WCB51_15440, partial [Candidatus Dormiibacterota bacterium]